MRLRSAAACAALTVSIVAPSAGFAASEAEWTYTDGSGQTVTLDEVPTTIIMHASAAAALIPLGIRRRSLLTSRSTAIRSSVGST